jgi:LmbE family N-acetylglucosaminyl deacetylase
MFDRILVLAPHTDDGEFGCGGTIARWIEEGKQVFYVAFSAAEKSVPSAYPSDVLRTEVKQATRILGIPPSNLTILDYEVRDFPEHRQHILDTMIGLKQELLPELVLLPSSFDMHQDHRTVYSEGLRAFKSLSILGYELPWNNLVFETKCFVRLSESHLQKKIKAVQCYKSQETRDYASEEFWRGLARTRGTQIGVLYAETYEVIRWMIP